MKLIAKITLSLLLVSNLVITASALTINTSSYHTTAIEADQKDKGGSQGKSGGGGGRDSGGSGSRDNNGGGSRDNMGSRPPERYNPPPRSDNRDGAKEPRVVVREKKKGDSE